MDKVILLSQLKSFTEEAVGDLLMPVRTQKADGKQDGAAEDMRSANVYLMRIPDSGAAYKKAPYILHQAITGRDYQSERELPAASAVVRSVFCVYCSDEEEGAMMLLNLMERLRIALLRKVVIGDQFELDLGAGIDTLVYPDDTAPYFLGEMATTWHMPAVRREVRKWLE